MIKPMGCKVLVKAFTFAENDKVVKAAKAAGIALPEFSERKAQVDIDKGVVVDIGPSVSDEYVKGLSVGDIIGFAKYGGKYISDPNDPDDLFLILNDEDVICVFKD